MAVVTGDASISGTGAASLTIYGSWSDRPYIMINDFAVTDHGRKASLSVKQIGAKSLSTTSGYSRHYYPRNTAKVAVSLNWTNLPDTSVDTYDGRRGRVELKSLASSKKALTLYIKKSDGTGYTQHSMYAEKYSESLVMRRNSAGGVLYNVTMNLVEL